METLYRTSKCCSRLFFENAPRGRWKQHKWTTKMTTRHANMSVHSSSEQVRSLWIRRNTAKVLHWLVVHDNKNAQNEAYDVPTEGPGSKP
jgi:hypothetical protein